MPEDTKQRLYGFQYELIKYKDRFREGIVIKYITYHPINILNKSNFKDVIKKASFKLS